MFKPLGAEARIMRSLVVIAAIGSLACGAHANHEAQTDGPVTFSIPDGPAPLGRPDLMMLIFNLSTALGEIIALDLTITGDVNQVGGFDPFADLGDQDSHFLFDPVAENLDILFANEDTTVLTAGFSGFEPFTDRDIAQLVMPQYEYLTNHYVANVTVRFLDGTTEQFSASDAIIPNYVPAPGCAALVSCGFMLLPRRRRSART